MAVSKFNRLAARDMDLSLRCMTKLLEAVLDIEFFLKERTRITLYFYTNASKPFIEIMEAIENNYAPYDNPPYSEDGEPPFLSEWLEANDAYLSVGLTALSMLSSAIQLFLSCWADRIERKGSPLKRKSKNGWL